MLAFALCQLPRRLHVRPIYNNVLTAACMQTFLTNPKFNGGLVEFLARRRLNGAEQWDGDEVSLLVFESAKNLADEVRPGAHKST